MKNICLYFRIIFFQIQFNASKYFFEFFLQPYFLESYFLRRIFSKIQPYFLKNTYIFEFFFLESYFFFKNNFWKSKIIFEIILKLFFCLLSIYLYIYYNPKFHITKTLPHPSTLNHKCRLVNRTIINIFFT